MADPDTKRTIGRVKISDRDSLSVCCRFVLVGDKAGIDMKCEGLKRGEAVKYNGLTIEEVQRVLITVCNDIRYPELRAITSHLKFRMQLIQVSAMCIVSMGG